MGRKKQSPIEDAISVASLFPWWVNILLAIISFFILNYFANIENQPVNGPENIGQFVSKQMFITFAMFGKFIVPFIFIIGAIASAINQQKRKRLYSSVVHTKPVERDNYNDSLYDPIDNMSWQEFETLVSAFFREQGYSVRDCGGGGPDGGVDLRLRKNGKKIIVQCKHWKTYKVGVKIVREQFGIMTAEGADEVIIVISGEYTNEAKEFAKNKNITLISGEKLRTIIRKGQKLQSKSKEKNNHPAPPNCPQCSSVMVERTAKKGKWAGNKFWGCPRFPKCKGIVQK
jgi:restriction system protein